MKARPGKAEGITATAHSRAERDAKGGAFARRVPPEGGSNLARILYAVITRRVPYNEEEAFKLTPATTARRLHNLKNQAARLGFQLLPVPESMV